MTQLTKKEQPHTQESEEDSSPPESLLECPVCDEIAWDIHYGFCRICGDSDYEQPNE